MDPWVAFGSFSGWESQGGGNISAQEVGCHACSDCCYLPATQKFLVPRRVSLTLRKNITAVGASVGFEGKTLNFLP